MKRLKSCILAMLTILVLLALPTSVYASDYQKIPITMDGTANTVEYTDGALCTFTPTADGTISFRCTADSTIRCISLKSAYNGNYNFSTWIESSFIQAGVQKTKDFHVVAGKQYAIEIDAAEKDVVNTATLTLSFKPDPTITQIVFGKSEYKVTCGESFYLDDMKLYPDNAVNKDIEWEYDKNGIYHYTNNHFLADKTGVYTLTAKAAKGTATASVKVIIVPKQVSYVRQDTSKTTQKQITVEWNAISDKNIAGYNVYQYDSAKKKWKLCGTTKKNKLVVKKLKTEKSYKFKVAAFVKNGSQKIEGTASKPATLYTAPKKVSAATITNMTTVGGDNSKNFVRVSWKKVKGATGYKVYGRTENGQFKLLASVTSTSELFYAGRGYTYGFKVVAYRSKHNISTLGKASAIKNYTSNLY